MIRFRLRDPALPPRIKLDWKAYFLEFCQKHGEPVQWKGRLLFRDGWMYSASDYGGPETPPPKDFDELDQLCLSYWLVRRSTLLRRLSDLLQERRTLSIAQSDRSVPLQVLVRREEEDGMTRVGYAELDFTTLDTHIDWFKTDIAECDIRLRELNVERPG